MSTAINAPSPIVRPMTIAGDGQLIALMSQTPGVSQRDADSRESTQRWHSPIPLEKNHTSVGASSEELTGSR
jgi:hypothetical protein